MYWNYRILKKVISEGTEDEETELHIVEAYYKNDGSLLGWTKDGCVFAENLAELRNTLECMLESLDKPIYVEADLLAEAAALRETGAEDIFPNERLSINEVIESLGLETEDVELPTNLSTVVEYLEPDQLEEVGHTMPLMLEDAQIEEFEIGHYPSKVNQPSDRLPVPGPTYPDEPLPEPTTEEISRWEDNGGGIQ